MLRGEHYCSAAVAPSELLGQGIGRAWRKGEMAFPDFGLRVHKSSWEMSEEKPNALFITILAS